jgi:3,4-dihydroxy 2-butanone 4-phosphate synthase/GTP cyclohydrolase II
MVPIEALLAGAEAKREKSGCPLVTLSYAQSLDGSIAARRGEPLRLSGPQAMEMTHRLRSAHDAILVGIGTVLADDPRLNVRLVEGRDPQPVVLDSRLRTPLEARLLHGARQPWIVTLPGTDRQVQLQLEGHGARILQVPPGEDGRLSLPALLECLGQLGIHRLMVEGGASVIASFFEQRLVDCLVLTIASRIVGGLHIEVGQAAILPLLEPGYERLGDDLIVWGAFS